VNNIAQRVSGSLGLAGLTVLATSQQAQLMADRAALIPANSDVAAVQHIVDQGPGMVYAYYQQLSLYVMADAYSNIFLVCCVLTAAAVVLALFLHSGAPASEAPAPAAPAAGATATPISAAATPTAVPARVAATPAGGTALVTESALTPELTPEPAPTPLEPAIPHHRGAESGDPHADPRVTVGAAYRRD
jgi:hypothetical protein